VVLASGAAFPQAQPPGAAQVKRYPWDERQPKCFLPDVIPTQQCKANDWPNYGESKRHIDRLLIEPDYDLLERAENELGFSDKQFASGYYYFDAWFLSLDTLMWYQSQPMDKVVSGWAKAKGETGYVKLCEALLRSAEAWNARGSGYANTVTPEAWDIYRRKLVEADQLLDSASDRLKRTGPWFVVKLRITYQIPERAQSRKELLEAGSQLWPEYTKIYTTAADLSMPKWGGTYREVDRIARLAAERTKAKWGASWYAVVYEQLFRTPGDATLADSAVDWALMKQGFRDYEARGRADRDYLEAFAKLACTMRDRQEARRLLESADKWAAIDLRLRPIRAERLRSLRRSHTLTQSSAFRSARRFPLSPRPVFRSHAPTAARGVPTRQARRRLQWDRRRPLQPSRRAGS
jgi:hypothetical protein